MKLREFALWDAIKSTYSFYTDKMDIHFFILLFFEHRGKKKDIQTAELWD